VKVDHLEVLVEEPSMEAALRALLPRIVSASFEVYTYNGKDDLLAKLPERLRGYAKWIPQSWRIVVVVDEDRTPCRTLKAKLEAIAAEAKLTTLSVARAKKKPPVVINRIAVEELEAWYFGDWEAVRAAYPKVPETIPAQAKFRNPDAITGGTWEAFERVLKDAGYFSEGLRKIEAARTIATQMVPERNQSKSFQVLRDALTTDFA
jgi:hypothetical protein